MALANKASPNGVKRLPQPQAKAKFLEFLAAGMNIPEALSAVGLSARSTYESWRRDDSAFRENADYIQSRRKGGSRREMPTFEVFARDYLHEPLFTHQLQWVDILEDRAPRDLHPSMTYEPSGPNYLLVNTPPEHPAWVGEPVLTRDGWKTVGEVTDDDWLFGIDGAAHPVLDTWDAPENVPLFRVTFNTGDSVLTDANHKWITYRYSALDKPVLHTTASLGENLRSGRTLLWRVPVVRGPLEGAEADLPVDPYLLGYWLGDGCYRGSVIAVGDQDTDALVTQIALAGYESRVTRDSRGRSNVAYVHSLRAGLRAAGVLGVKEKTVPAAYMTASPKQRLALLQGLLDSDGTITAKDGRARFVQHGRPDLCRAVYRLIASLGYQPRMKTYGAATEIAFKPDEEPVFRLERKAARQFTQRGNRRTDFRTVVSVEPAGTGAVRCFTVLSDDNQFLIGDGLVPTRNAKSTTITQNYVTYRIVDDPTCRVIVVSKTQKMAKNFLYAIRTRLTNPRYRKMQMEFGPVEGYAKTADQWAADQIVLNKDDEDDSDLVGQKDPTVLALGIGGQIYGARADLIILDDCVTLSNAHDYEAQVLWLTQEVLTRLSENGKLLIVGTRVASLDLYKYLRNEFPGQWTYLAQPAVLEFGDTPEQWKTLWPETVDANGKRVSKWNGERLAKRQKMLTPATWSMAYMQADVDASATFPEVAVLASWNKQRYPGIMVDGAPGHRKGGMNGLYRICSLDPAISGYCGAVVLGVDQQTRKRYVLDVYNQAQIRPQAIFDLIRDWTVKYKPHMWVIEKNAMNVMISQDEPTRAFLLDHNCILREHFTGKNKWDVDFGVASMASLFLPALEEPPRATMIELPKGPPNTSHACDQLIPQLVSWSPETKNPTDMVMALWFAEIRARELVDRVNPVTHMKNRYVSKARRAMRGVLNLDEEFARQQFEPQTVN